VVTAIDHTHCFGDTLHFTTALSHIGVIQDETIFGLFPEFGPLLRKLDLELACDMLSEVMASELEPIVEAVPQEWEVPPATRLAWLDMLVRRAGYVAGSLVEKVFP
jgi:hypothetical protein